MASAIKKVDKIRQVVQLKQMMRRWKAMSLKRRPVSDTSSDCESDTVSSRRIPPGFLAVYVGSERCRFLIPTRFVNMPVFASLLRKAEEEFGYQSEGGLVLPCEVGFFRWLLNVLEKDEQRLRGLELDDVLKIFSEVGIDSCKDGSSNSHGFSPLLQKTRV